MTGTIDPLQDFRHVVNRRARRSPGQWESSKRLLNRDMISTTLARLQHAVDQQPLPDAVQEQLRRTFHSAIQRLQDVDATALKALTGFPPTKALRALCVYFDLIKHPASRWPLTAWTDDDIEQILSRTDNPFDLLLQSDVASVLDVGAGDLSFASELAEQYLPPLREQHRPLILHCVDRLHPSSQLGGPLHASPARLEALQQTMGPSFGFYGNQDMFHLQELEQRGKLASRYTIATCWAPATPTFAYDPTRLTPAVIAEHLRRTKGSFQQTRFNGESALEVHHGERTLLFPSWKFDILGPVALLNLLAQRGAACVLGAVDTQVFWELMAHLLDDPRFRPQNQPFTPQNLPEIFGEVYEALERLPLGTTASLADVGRLRSRLPKSDAAAGSASGATFRSIRIRRGATFTGVPASSTARTFSAMTEEAPPWLITLVPKPDSA